MQTVRFTQMKDGTREEYQFLREKEEHYLEKTADRVVRELALQAEDTLSGYRVTRLEHALQSATRASRDNADIDWVVAALLHDIGDGLAPQNHDRFAAEILRPFTREEVTWVVEHHGAFQMYYYAHHYGWDRHERDQYAHNPYYKSCLDFCERWDQSSFDPDYDNLPLEFFVPLVAEVFSRKAYDPEYLQSGIVIGLPATV
ncbi:MAG: peptidase [marine bacterium B5-7]|nr:MAG: peptidase [marine bacterium B5-7]